MGVQMRVTLEQRGREMPDDEILEIPVIILVGDLLALVTLQRFEQPLELFADQVLLEEPQQDIVLPRQFVTVDCISQLADRDLQVDLGK